MSTLNDFWITEGPLDFEYKKYKLLAYLKHVRAGFKMNELYPEMSDLVHHYHNLVELKERKELIQVQFPKRLESADLSQLKLTYEKLVTDDQFMEELKAILDYAIPQMGATLEAGKAIHDFVEENLNLEPISII